METWAPPPWCRPASTTSAPLSLVADRAMYDATAAGRNGVLVVGGGYPWDAMNRALAC